MGRVSKVVEYGLVDEAMELMFRKGLGPQVTAKILNRWHRRELPVPLNYQNVQNWRDTIPKHQLKALEEESVQRFYIDPIKEIRAELELVRGDILPLLTENLEDGGDVKDAERLYRMFIQSWDRVAKIEKLIEPRSEMKAKYIQINQQFNDFMQLFQELYPRLCGECQSLFLDATNERVIDAVTEPLQEVKHETA